MGAVSKRRAVSIRGEVSDRGNTVINMHVGYSTMYSSGHRKVPVPLPLNGC